MGYYLQALIGRDLSQHALRFKSARVVALQRGLQMIPLTDDLHREIGAGGELPGFDRLSPEVEEWARQSTTEPVAYVEAEFFGGVGGQAALVWAGGARILGPVHDVHAINQALRLLGVRSEGAYDEFDAVDLGKHRDTRDWLS